MCHGAKLLLNFTYFYTNIVESSCVVNLNYTTLENKNNNNKNKNKSGN